MTFMYDYLQVDDFSAHISLSFSDWVYVSVGGPLHVAT